MMEESRDSIANLFTNEVRRAHNPVILRYSERTLPGFHLVEDEIIDLDLAVCVQILTGSIVVILATLPRHYPVVPINREKL